MGQDRPTGELAIQTIAMPADTNPKGDIFGGWLLSQMDLAAYVIAKRISNGRAATIAIDAMTFKKPVKIGDVVSCYVDIKKIGRTSMTFSVEAWANRHMEEDSYQVTAGTFVFVAIDKHNKPRVIQTLESPDKRPHPIQAIDSPTTAQSYPFPTSPTNTSVTPNANYHFLLMALGGLMLSTTAVAVALLALSSMISLPLAASAVLIGLGTAGVSFFGSQTLKTITDEASSNLTFRH